MGAHRLSARTVSADLLATLLMVALRNATSGQSSDLRVLTRRIDNWRRWRRSNWRRRHSRTLSRADQAGFRDRRCAGRFDALGANHGGRFHFPATSTSRQRTIDERILRPVSDSMMAAIAPVNVSSPSSRCVFCPDAAQAATTASIRSYEYHTFQHAKWTTVGHVPREMCIERSDE